MISHQDQPRAVGSTAQGFEWQEAEASRDTLETGYKVLVYRRRLWLDTQIYLLNLMRALMSLQSIAVTMSWRRRKPKPQDAPPIKGDNNCGAVLIFLKNSSFLIKVLLLLVGARVWHTCVMAHMWRTEDILWESGLSFHRVDSRDRTPPIRLGGVIVSVFVYLVDWFCFLFLFLSTWYILVSRGKREAQLRRCPSRQVCRVFSGLMIDMRGLIPLLAGNPQAVGPELCTKAG